MLTGDLRVETDDGVRFVFAVRNAGDERVDLEFGSSCRADFAVYEAGEERWRWSDGRMFTQMIEHLRLEPGESETFEVEWDAPRSGEFVGRAELRARDGDCVAETGFSA
jgi:hypothetical protein